MQGLSHVGDLHHSSRQHRILNPLSKARDQTRVLLGTSWICFCWAMMGTLEHEFYEGWICPPSASNWINSLTSFLSPCSWEAAHCGRQPQSQVQSLNKPWPHSLVNSLHWLCVPLFGVEFILGVLECHRDFSFIPFTFDLKRVFPILYFKT